MKKKVCLFGIIAFFAATAIFAAANGGMDIIGGSSGRNSGGTDSDVNMSDSVITVSGQISSNDFDTIAAYIGYDTYESFKTLHDLLVFMGQYCTTKGQYELVKNMVLSGCDVKTVMDIYQFYLTTNENVSIVSDIYNIVWEGEKIENRDVVFEGAFNKLTNNKCGVLTKEDIEAYLERGVSVSDIAEANLLSRKGVLTVQQILNEIESGTDWEEIVEQISGETITAQCDDASLLTQAMSTAAITGRTIDSVLSSGESYFSDVERTVNAAMKAKGYWKARPSANTQAIISEAAEKGISAETVTEMLDSGYSECAVINALNNENCSASAFAGILREEASR